MLLPMKWIGSLTTLLDGGSPTTTTTISTSLTKPLDLMVTPLPRRSCRFAADRRMMAIPPKREQSPHTSDEDRGGGTTGNHLQPRTTSGNHQNRRNHHNHHRHGKERHCSIEDDEHGHLIYKTGDVLQDRCTVLFFYLSIFLFNSILSLAQNILSFLESTFGRPLVVDHCRVCLFVVEFSGFIYFLSFFNFFLSVHHRELHV